MGFSPFLPAYLKYQKTIDISIKKYYNKKVISKTKKSSKQLIYAPLAQLVEQLTLNQMVGGSNPLWCTKEKQDSFSFFVSKFYKFI